MTTTDTEQALIRAVLENPADDTPRLVLADWWEDHGQPERAEFVRVQCELARMAGRGPGPGGGMPATDHGGACLELRRREMDAGNAVKSAIWASLPPGFGLALPGYWPPEPFGIPRRGFVGEVRLTLAAFLEHARDLFSRHPVTRVELTDRAPTEWTTENDGGRWVWIAPLANQYRIPGDLPPRLFDRLTAGAVNRDGWARRYPTAAAARDDLSAACVALGRGLAGLPPLEAA